VIREYDRSTDGGMKWDCVGRGEQIWRAIGVAFTEEAIFWGTDSGYDSGQTRNFIVRTVGPAPSKRCSKSSVLVMG
jgi:hypothetical protein